VAALNSGDVLKVFIIKRHDCKGKVGVKGRLAAGPPERISAIDVALGRAHNIASTDAFIYRATMK